MDKYDEMSDNIAAVIETVCVLVCQLIGDELKKRRFIQYADAKVIGIVNSNAPVSDSDADSDPNAVYTGGTATLLLDDDRTEVSGLMNNTPFTIRKGGWVRIYYTDNISDGYIGFVYR